MDTLSDQYVTTVGMFNHIKINETIAKVLLKLNRDLTKSTISRNKNEVVRADDSLSFMKLTKKKKLFYLVNTLNKLKNQIVKYNVKKLFQLWHVYHRENKIVNVIVNILCKLPQYDIKTIRRDILQKNTKSAKNKKQRDEICQEICQKGDLLRVFDKKSFKYCLDNFNTSIATLKKKTPIILCFNKSDIDSMITLCSYEKNFPIHLLPKIISQDIKQILKNKIPKEKAYTKQNS